MVVVVVVVGGCVRACVRGGRGYMEGGGGGSVSDEKLCSATL